MKKCEKCESTELKRHVVKAIDSHNNLVEYHCNDCNHVTTKMEHIEDGAA